MEIIFLIILLVCSFILLRQTQTYTVPSFDTSGGPAMFPQYVLILLVACIVILILQLAIKKQGKEFVFFELFRGERGVFLAAIVAYVLILSIFGFLLATVLFLVFTVNFLTKRYEGTIGSAKQVLVRSTVVAVFAVGVTFLFADVFRIMLPRGSIF